MTAKSGDAALTAILAALAIALIVALWVVAKLITFHESSEQTVMYTDAAGVTAGTSEFRCTQMSAADFDVRDYSYNVVKTPPVNRMYRYKTNIPAEPPLYIHVLAMEGGSGRVAVAATDKPVWLVLLSTQPGIWHIERSPGARLQKIVTNQNVSEIRFFDAISNQASSVIDYLLDGDAVPAEPPELVVLPNSPCLTGFTRFQSYDDQKTFLKTLASIRSWLGHPEMSFQSAEFPSYFETPFRVPFSEPQISIEKLAAVKKLSEPPAAPPSRRAAASEQRALTAALQQYADMPRRDDVEAITFAAPGDFLRTLNEYRTRKLLPSSMPKSQPGSRRSGVTSWYSFADYQNAYTRRVPAGETNACGSGADRRLLIIEGTAATNIVKCAHGDQLYFMGEGDDHVDDSWQDDIIYGGPGNDILDAGWGNDLLFFNYGWGQDSVRKTCHNSSYVPQDSVNSANVYWARDWPYKNFIVFGKDVRRDDIVSVNDKLVHKVTGDSVSIQGNCFNVVYWQ